MPTIGDLREVLREFEAHAGDPAAVQYRLDGAREAGRRWGQPLLAAAFVLALVSGAALVANPEPHRSGAGPGAATPPGGTSNSAGRVTAPSSFDVRSYWFSVASLAGLTQVPDELFRDSQRLELDRNGVPYATVTLYAVGAQHPGAAAGSTPVSVGGRPGQWGMIGTVDGAVAAKGLVWQYAANAWATVLGVGDASISAVSEAVRIAEAVRPATPSTVSIPARVGYLPVGLLLQGVVSSVHARDGGTGGSSEWSTLVDFGRSGGATVLTVEVGGTALRKGPHSGVPIASHGMSGTWDAASSTVTLDGAGFVIRVACLPDADGALPYGRDELIRVADGLTLASQFSDKSTWFPAATALH